MNEMLTPKGEADLYSLINSLKASADRTEQEGWKKIGEAQGIRLTVQRIALAMKVIG